MRRWTSEWVCRALETDTLRGEHFTQISTDTRRLGEGALFVALHGARFDGHDYLADARTGGATGAVVQRGTRPVEGLRLFEVEDTLAALGRLARARRRELDGPVLAVTGSNGKTSTKEMLVRVLATRWVVHATWENLNNLVGVPLTILGAPEETETLVVEAGASVPGEMARLRDIIEPTMAIVTNVSAAHLEGFGSLEATFEEKTALLERVPVAIVGTTPPALGARATTLAGHVIVAGVDRSATVRPDAWRLDDDGKAVLTFRGHQIRLPVLGPHQVDNAMLALGAAEVLGVDLAAAAAALEQVTLPPGRCEVIRHGELVVLYDAYNANPASLEASLDTAAAMQGNRPLVVALGSMLELGPASPELHDRMADAVMARSPALVAAIGAFIPAFERHRPVLGERLMTAETAETLGEALAARLRGNELLLLKASRGMHLERAIPFIIPDGERSCSTTC